MPGSATMERQLGPGASTLTVGRGLGPIASPGKRTLVEMAPTGTSGAPAGAAGTTIAPTGRSSATSSTSPHNLDARSSADHGAPSANRPTAIADAGLLNAGDRSASDRALGLCQLGIAHLAAIEAALVPAYRRAVAAMDTAAVKALALQIIGGVARIVDAQAHVVRLVPQVDTRPHAVTASTSETDPWAPDPSQLAALIQAHTTLDVALRAKIPRLAVQVSPQWFGEDLVAGRAPEPSPHVQAVVVQLAYEAGLVVQLLEEADAIEALIRPTDEARSASEPATDVARAQALDRVERWRTRPVNFLFLVRVLTRRGLWQAMQGVQNVHGHTADELQHKVAAQSRETGTTADVGDLWDTDEAHRALSYSATDWKVTDAEAWRVLEMLANAEPRARAGLVKQLYRMGRLRPLCEHLPWGMIKQLWESIDDPEASRLLEPYWDGKGGGKSLGKRLKDQDHWYTDVLNRFLDISTFGAKPRIDAAHDAREAGLITDDAYWGSVTKAVGRSAFVMAAMTATGGLGGAFAGGASEGLGVTSAGTLGRAITTVASGAAEGAVGNVAGHFVGDVYDQVLDGKEGFDSLGTYGRSLAEGAAIGGLTTAAVGLTASRFLREGARTLAQQAAVARPQLTRLLEAARSAARGEGVRVKITVRELLESVGGEGPPGLRFAYAHATGGALPARIASAPPSSAVWVTVRPFKDLNAPAPMQMANRHDDDGGYLGEIEDLELSDEIEAMFNNLDHGEAYSHPDAESFAGESSRLGEDGPELDAVTIRRTRTEAGVVNEPGEVETHQHHVFPQEKAAWFKARGIDVDEWCIDLTPPEHQAQHGGGGWRLAREVARKHPDAGWNAAVMDRLLKAEARKRLVARDPNIKLTAAEILKRTTTLMTERGLGSQSFRRYSR